MLRTISIVSKTLGAKKISTRGKTGGGVEVIEENAEARQALSDEDILRLAATLAGKSKRNITSPRILNGHWQMANCIFCKSRAITSLISSALKNPLIR